VLVHDCLFEMAVRILLLASAGLECEEKGLTSPRLGISDELGSGASESLELDSSSPDSQYGTRLAAELVAADELSSCC
jgi:hypothetical protein